MKNIYKSFILLLPVVFILQPLILKSQSNQYLHFDHEDDFVILNEAGQYVDGSNTISITGWFNCDELGYGQGYMGFRSGASGLTSGELVQNMFDDEGKKATTTEYILQQIVFVVPSAKRNAILNRRKQEASNMRTRFVGCGSSREFAKGLRDVSVIDIGRRLLDGIG